MELPVLFEERMRRMLLPEEYEQFLKSYEREQYHALRVNTLKIRRKEFLERGLFDLEPVPWCENGFYYGENERPGKHPFHEAGLYYIQEPSAMSAAALADVQPGEYVLDLCAASPRSWRLPCKGRDFWLRMRFIRRGRRFSRRISSGWACGTLW